MELPIGLDDLGRAVEAQAAGSPLARLRRALETTEQLHELGDELLDRFVREARASGCSWTEIGALLGVSKQAAQQRFAARRAIPDGAWPERFTEAARRAVERGAAEARALGHNYLGTEHVLLGLVSETDGIAVRALAALGVTEVAVREHIDELIGTHEPAEEESLCVMPRLKQALELARRPARALGRDSADTEHLLLGLIHVKGALAARILADLGANDQRVRDQLAPMLGVDASELAAAVGRRRRRLRRLVRIPS